MKVFVIGGNTSVERIFLQEGADVVDNLDQADTIVWTGGSDVSPNLYGEVKHPRTYDNPSRDKYEQACWFRAMAHKDKLLVGICRGGQFLNVMNGGSLWQHVDNHTLTGEHVCTYRKHAKNGFEIKQYMVTSTHHQQMIPNKKTPCEVWGFTGLCTKKESGLFNRAGERIVFLPSPGHTSDAEIVWYPESKSLCFQPHPEYSSKSTRDLFFDCVERALAH